MDKHYTYDKRVILSKVLLRLSILKSKGFIMSEFDFDYLKDMYINNPLEFEKISRGMIKEVIASFPKDKQPIYKAKQWRLEQELKKVKDPLEKMNRLVSLFWEQTAIFLNATSNFGVTKPDTKPNINNIDNIIDINKEK